MFVRRGVLGSNHRAASPSASTKLMAMNPLSRQNISGRGLYPTAAFHSLFAQRLSTDGDYAMIRLSNKLKLRWGISFTGKWLLVCGFLVSLFIMWFPFSTNPQDRVYWISVSYYGFVAFIVVVGIIDWFCYFRPFSRRLRDNDWRLCPFCGYPFQGDAEVICTECGNTFVGAKVRTEWMAWIKPPRIKSKR